MIDKYRLDDLRLESGEKGELARWVIQLQTDLDRERRKVGNSPVIGIDPASGHDRSVEVRYFAPPGYVMVPKKLTAENGAKAALLGEFNLEYTLTCHECFGDGCDDCSGEGTWTNTIPIDWTTIKAIWAKAVEHFVATPAGGEE
ncbi:TPA: hypothetical protein LVL12_002179 [Klebsiella oxytoca]|nr:hypothetical protein [Klebsiella oxytoca]